MVVRPLSPLIMVTEVAREGGAGAPVLAWGELARLGQQPWI